MISEAYQDVLQIQTYYQTINKLTSAGPQWNAYWRLLKIQTMNEQSLK